VQFRLQTRTLSFRVFLIAAVAVAVFSTTFTIAFASYFVSESEKSLVMTAEAIGNLLAVNLTAPMDFAEVLGSTDISEDGNLLLKSALADDNVVYALVVTQSGSVFAKAGKVPEHIVQRFKKQADGNSYFIDQLVNTKTSIRGDKKEYGSLYLGLSRERLNAAGQEIVAYSIPVTLGLSTLFIAGFFLLVSRLVVRPVQVITGLVRRIGEGDVRQIDDVVLGTNTTEIVAMFDALRQTTDTFRENLRAISTVVTELNATSGFLMEASEKLSAAGNEQATAVSETTVTIEQVEKTGHVTAQNARDIQMDADRTRALSRDGLDAVGDTRRQLQEIEKQVANIVESSIQLNQRLTEVDRIVASVASVTQQSHTLSINASIEAVKAGEKGLGFGVVARQMRDLSLQSREATEQVRKTLTGIQAGIAVMLATTEQGLAAVKQGVGSMERTGQLISRVGESIEKSTGAASTIAHNTMQQATGLAQTARAMNEITDAARRNVESIDFLRRSGNDLKEHGIAMQALVDLFRIE